jgi:pyrroloquinoline-quinone synthase
MSHVPKTEERESTEAFLQGLDGVIAGHAMLEHPFYRAWSRGELSRRTLSEYAKQYYAHVRNFPVYVSATHSHCDDIEVRQQLLENLIEEERGADNHPELWLRFAEGIGVTQADVRSSTVLPKTASSVNTMKTLTRSENYLEGVAALYAYESQIPGVSRVKREGLKIFYGISDERAVSFFTVHEEADLAHRETERRILANNATDATTRRLVLDAAQGSAKALLTFLDGVYEAFV